MSEPPTIHIEKRDMPWADDCHYCGKMVLYYKDWDAMDLYECPWCGEKIRILECAASRTGPIDLSRRDCKFLIPIDEGADDNE